MSEMNEEQRSSQNDSPRADQTHRIFGLEAIVVALVLFIVGLAFITLGAILPEGKGLALEIAHHLLRDLGIAAIISALLGSAYEYGLRSDFLKVAQQALSGAVAEERQWLTDKFVADAETSLTRVLDVRDDRLKQLDQFRAAGLQEIHEALNAELLKEKFSNAIQKAQSTRGGSPTIRILDTWTDLGMWGIMDHIKEAASEGCRVEMLLLDPRSRQVEYRAEAMDKPTDWVKSQIEEELQTLCRISSGLQKSGNSNLEVKVYDAAPTNHIYDFDGTMLIGIYWRKSASFSGPQMEIVAQNERSQGADLVRRINLQFEDLWKRSETHAAEIVKKLDEANNEHMSSGSS